MAFWGAEGDNSMLREGQSRIKSKCRLFHRGQENNSFLVPEGKPCPPETAGTGSLQLRRLLHSAHTGSSLGSNVCFPFSWDLFRDGCRERCRSTNHQRPNNPIQVQTDAVFLKVFKVI